jgi:hypothetical protein
LHLESKLIYSSDGSDYIRDLGKPAPYSAGQKDCSLFIHITRKALESCRHDRGTLLFDLSTAFLGIRNFSTCYLLTRGKADFTRNVALTIFQDLNESELLAYSVLEKSRILCTRGLGRVVGDLEASKAIEALPGFIDRMTCIAGETE